MIKYKLPSIQTTAPEATTPSAQSGSEIKLGLDIHQSKYVIVAQYDHATPRAPRSSSPDQFLPWIDGLLREGHRVHVLYEACGFGFGLCRQLRERGVDAQVIAPQRLDERHTGVKTDGRDAKTTLPAARPLAGGEQRRPGHHPHPQRRSLPQNVRTPAGRGGGFRGV